MRCVLCNSTTGVHGHHDIPRAFGGEKGPTTDLCGSHHTAVHSLALEYYKHQNMSLLVLPKDVPKSKIPELQRLIKTIDLGRRAFELAKEKGDVKQRSVLIKFDSRRREKIVQLARLLKCSQQEAANTAVDRLHQSLVARSKA